MPLILPARTLDTGGYVIDNSLRFNRDDNAYLEKTFSGSPTSTKICTISFWLKLADPSIIHAKAIFSAIKSGSSEDVIKFGGTNGGNLGYIELNFDNTSNGSLVVGDGSSLNLFRDPSAFSHFVIAFDTSQGTASNRIKFYQNGTLLQTESRIEGGSVTNDIAISQNYDLGFLTASKHQIGMNAESSNSEPFDGYLSEFHFVDGQQLAPTSFAETNDNGVWIPKDCKDDLTYGNYGFFLEFKQTGTSADASGKGADTSGNGNHFDDNNLTVEDQTTDTPTNNFCTINSVFADAGTNTVTADYSEGNTKLLKTVDGWGHGRGTFLLSSGKWYVEAKVTETGTGQIGQFGIVPSALTGTTDANDKIEGLRVNMGGSDTIFQKMDTGTGSNVFTDFASGDIVMLAIDLDSNKLWVGNDGTWYNNNNASTTLNSSNHDVTLPSNDEGWIFTIGGYRDGGNNLAWEFNWGNPSFSISSSNSDANGYGNMEFAVPTGFYTCCTKNLAEYG